MDETFFMNFGGYNSSGNFKSISSVRLWPSILATVRWMLQAQKKPHNMIYSGVGLVAINNLAIAVEGFIGDLIFAKLDTNSEIQHKDLTDIDKLTWYPKRDLYNKHFQKKLEQYSEYQTIRILVELRNNLSHGRTYTEYTIAENESCTERSKIKSENKRYQEAREFFISNNLLADTNQMSNHETLWKLPIALFFLHAVQRFTYALLADNPENLFIGIKGELQHAFKI